jgi:hypothetical protein
VLGPAFSFFFRPCVIRPSSSSISFRTDPEPVVQVQPRHQYEAASAAFRIIERVKAAPSWSGSGGGGNGGGPVGKRLLVRLGVGCEAAPTDTAFRSLGLSHIHGFAFECGMGSARIFSLSDTKKKMQRRRRRTRGAR